MSQKNKVAKKTLLKAFKHMCNAKALTELYEANSKVVSKYVHATSRGHEAIQIAAGMQLKPDDFVSPYYRDDSILLSIGITPFQLILQLLAKADDPFSGGRLYYAHPSLRDDDKPKIIHQSSSTGMQAIPSTGIAMGMQYKEKLKIAEWSKKNAPFVICSLGDASVTEGEVAEAFQMAALKQLPIIFLIQDNGWDISATAEETRAMNAVEYIAGFPGIEAVSVDGSNYLECHQVMSDVTQKVRKERRPFLVHATVPLLNHHTSGVRMEWYRDDLEEQKADDPFPIFKKQLLGLGITNAQLTKIQKEAINDVDQAYRKAIEMPEPSADNLHQHSFAPTLITEEVGTRTPVDGEEKVMVDCALIAVEELMREHKECLLYGQDVGFRLGGVFREAATLAQKFGSDRVFNTAIQEAFIIGSTAGMSAVRLKPIVEVQFADYIWPGLNQLFSEISKSCYLTNGKWPISMILRVPCGAYGSGGPYHSSCLETVLANIRGIKIAFPSNGADLKGLMKAAYYDPNPCIIFEHKGLYWSKVPGTDDAKCIMPAEDYRLPFGKGNMVLEAAPEVLANKPIVLIVTYGMGVHWALNAAKDFDNNIGILDIRTLAPLDTPLIYKQSKLYHRIIVLTEEPSDNSFAQSIAARIQEHCFEELDAPVITIGAENIPAIPINEALESAMLPSAKKLSKSIQSILEY